MAVLLESVDPLVQGRTRMLDMREGGQNGAMLVPQEWISNAGYMKQKVIAVLLTAPGAVQYMDNPDVIVASLKALVENMPLSITGLQSGIDWEYNETPVGNAGEQFETVAKANRARSTPSFRWSERYASSIQRFWTELGRLCVMDPDLSFPGIVAKPKYTQAGSPPILPDMQSMCVLFIEPDETMTNVTHCWLCANMMPKSGGEINGSREIAGSAEIPEVNIDFTAFTMTGAAVAEQAKAYLASLNLANLRPTELKPFVTGASADVQAAQTGFKQKIDAAVASI